ncbi:hypothetical protein ACJJTC_001439 [Scirpophaga incertulas]
MENIKVTLEALQKSISTRMSAFESELKKSRSQSPTIDSLTMEFDNFRTFVVDTLRSIELQVSAIVRANDAMEMRSRRNILLLHGVPEGRDEDAVKTFLDLTRKHLTLPQLSSEAVSKSVRLGHQGKDKPRPLLVKFNSETIRDNVWFAKAGFKGTGFTISEFLTKHRHGIFKAARDLLGVSNCWTQAGRIIALDRHGKRYNIASLSDIENLKQSTASKPSVVSAGVSATDQGIISDAKNKPRRRAASAKRK